MRMLFGKKTIAESDICSQVPEKTKYIFLISFAFVLLILAFVFNTPSELIRGSLIILSSPANLLTDYFALANVGSALLNASVMAFFSIGTVAISRAKISGSVLAAIFTVTGFSLFGKNLYNSIPIVLGVICFGKLMRSSLRHHLPAAFFGTALGPLVSEFSFNLDLPLGCGIALGFLIGFFTGLVLPALAATFLRFHRGFNLYNIGFTAGIIGMFFVAILRSFGRSVDAVYLLSSGNNTAFILILYPMFIAMFLLGLAYNQWSFKGLGRIAKCSGKLTTDFLSVSGFGATLINMSFLGAFATSYVLLVGGELNGPVIGGIFTVVGFGAVGKHLRNVMPVVLGVFLVGLCNKEGIYSTPAVIAALFGTTLAPVSGHYGPVAGIIAGALHMTMTMNISYLHAGMNLYNNGFSGGFVAAALVPIFHKINEIIKLNSKPARTDDE